MKFVDKTSTNTEMKLKRVHHQYVPAHWIAEDRHCYAILFSVVDTAATWNGQTACDTAS